MLIGSISYYAEMKKILLALGVPNGKIIHLLKSREKSFNQAVKEVWNMNNIYASLVNEKYFSYYFKNYAICTMYLEKEDRNKKLYKYQDYLLKGIDYVRVSTIDLLAREVNERNIEGAVAELGVYQGHFSKLLHDFFPNRELLLFDTFEGFHENDVKIDQEVAYSQAQIGHLSDTNIDLVLSKLSRRYQVHVIKGYFPESAITIEDRKYALVSIDVDLYQPTYEGLNYFYERLSKGGYIIVHDYNFQLYKGVKQAVRNFCREIGIGYFPVSDYFGSVLITK